MTAAWAAAALLDALRAEVAGVLDDEHASRQHALEQAAGKLATAAAAFHAADDELADGEDIEPYCLTCGAWLGIFHNLAGWRHFRGDPAPGRQRELYEAGHEAAPAFCPPPGRAGGPAQARTAGQALTDAITYRLERADGGCADCAHGPAGACPDHVADTGRALAYRQLAAILARALPEIRGEERRPGRAGRPRSSPGCGPGPAITTRTSAPLSSCSSSTMSGCGARTSPGPASSAVAGGRTSTG